MSDNRISASGLEATTQDAPVLEMLPIVGPDLACTLDSDEADDRLAEWQALAATAVSRATTDKGIRFTFSRSDVRAIADLVAREQSCCSFLSFEIGVNASEVTLKIAGPTETRPLIETLV